MNIETQRLILRTMYIDSTLDDQLRDVALKKNIPKSDLIVFSINKGLKLKKTPIKLKEKNKQGNLILRYTYISTTSEDILRTMAFDLRIDKNDLIRQYLAWGFEAIDDKDLLFIKKNAGQSTNTENVSKTFSIDEAIKKQLISYMKKNKITTDDDIFFNSILKLGFAELKKINKEKKLQRIKLSSKINL